MIRLLLAAIIFLFLYGEGMAADENGNFPVFTPGNEKCTDFLNDYAKSTMDIIENEDSTYIKNTSDIALEVGWIYGYLTAINKTRLGKEDFFSDLGLLDTLGWIASWCRDNPTKSLYDATNSFALRDAATYTINGIEIVSDPDIAEDPYRKRTIFIKDPDFKE